ncbi:MAG: hypothetical protein IID46_12245 [Planctomycetes bacterium]|nr:hypothetical protein [Planctomycetota bacterium]
MADKLEEVIYESPAGPITPLDCLYGLRSFVANDNLFMSHHTGFTATSLKQHLEDAGFVEINTWHSSFSLWAEAWKR